MRNITKNDPLGGAGSLVFIHKVLSIIGRGSLLEHSLIVFPTYLAPARRKHSRAGSHG